MNTARKVFPYSHKMKMVGIVCILWGFYAFFSKYWRYQLFDLNLLTGLGCWGLTFLFFSKEKIDDERVHQLKFKALTWALPVGLGITHLINYLVLSLPEPDSSKLIQSLSAYQALVIVLLLALATFHYLKHRE
ncbi:hypothetical protein [Hymenobacter sp. YC55]|uniref:hypothetical protein n=1 Tax=Hymenobacter sp. YC55 TaxID=3034019 RepID=UPI0023F97ACD|nr:hypothetical protein [Hymenobacter sp. YC55]MDF7813861.1 hypothetical protein [Hymenobacter sp. YC55]